MRLRPRPDSSAAAARVAALLPAHAGGWVPPHDGPGELADAEGPRPAPAGADMARGAGVGAPADGAEVAPSEPDARSWAGRGPGAHLAPGPRYRLDPGRRGAVALVLAALLAAAVAGAVALRHRPQEVAVPVVEAAGVPLPGASTAADPAAEVVVAVGGKVRRPGLVRLPAGSRVDDAVRAAGGPAAGADLGALNLARRLVDGEQVLVGVPPPPGAAAPAAAGGGPGALLDLNSATASDLDALPGIGPVLAQRIVEWRIENGRFASVDQLREVTGIGEAKYDDLQAKVTV